MMFVAACFTSGGILERFPELRVGLLEGNCSWAPFLACRLDEHWEWLGRYEIPDVRMKPSEYLLRTCFLSVEADETPARHYIEDVHLGAALGDHQADLEHWIDEPLHEPLRQLGLGPLQVKIVVDGILAVQHHVIEAGLNREISREDAVDLIFVATQRLLQIFRAPR
jgi:hypothetical protein